MPCAKLTQCVDGPLLKQLPGAVENFCGEIELVLPLTNDRGRDVPISLGPQFIRFRLVQLRLEHCDIHTRERRSVCETKGWRRHIQQWLRLSGETKVCRRSSQG